MPQPVELRVLGLVIVGGAVGVLARAAVVVPLADEPVVPWVTLAVNVAGSLLLGFVVGVLGDEYSRWRAFLGTGVLGGFTTYSAFAVHSVQLMPTPLVAISLMGVSLFAGALAALVGIVLGRRTRPSAALEPETAE
ncbi:MULTISPECIES: fluoride efflux transporter FluC [Microbacterium]|uniref:Fluoride-specific ion channel FluC n=1 Tax=Microbacterium marmarense TaxID=3122051 RepID=A0ABU8LQ43_9MICO